MPVAKQNFIDVPINKGTKPDWNTRLGYPRLFNMFCGESGSLYCTPGLEALNEAFPLINGRAIHYSPYNGGVYFVVTNNNIFRVNLAGSYDSIASIPFSGKAVQIDENLQNQIIIVDGINAYVYAQQTASFTQLGPTNGFNFKTPISVLVLNTFTIALDGETGSWAVSDPNNALVWPPLDTVPQIQSQLTTAVSLETLDDNLYIFGLNAIERWLPNTNTNVYNFAFARDNNFRTDFGALSTNSVIRGQNKIYFLSSKYLPMELSAKGIEPLADIGTSRIISEYCDVMQCEGSYFTFRGNYFYSMTFLETGISWVWNETSKTMAQSDDLIVGAAVTKEVVITPAGIYTLSLTPTHKLREWTSERVVGYKGPIPYRNLLNAFELRIVQGYMTPNPVQPPPLTGPERVELSVSLDSESWSNRVPRFIGRTGKRQAVLTWPAINMTGQQFTFRASYYGNLNFTIERATATIT